MRPNRTPTKVARNVKPFRSRAPDGVQSTNAAAIARRSRNVHRKASKGVPSHRPPSVKRTRFEKARYEGFGRLPPSGRATLYRAGRTARATEPRDAGLGPSGCDRCRIRLRAMRREVVCLLRAPQSGGRFGSPQPSSSYRARSRQGQAFGGAKKAPSLTAPARGRRSSALGEWAGAVAKNGSCLWPVPLTRPPTIKERSLAQTATTAHRARAAGNDARPALTSRSPTSPEAACMAVPRRRPASRSVAESKRTVPASRRAQKSRERLAAPVGAPSHGPCICPLGSRRRLQPHHR